MLDAVNSRVRRLLGRNADRNMPRERQAELRRFIGNGEEHFARRVVVDLDEIRALLLQPANRFPCLLSGLDMQSIGKRVGRVIDHRARGHDLRPERGSRPNALAQRKDEVRVRAHITRADHALRHKQIYPIRARGLVMRMHVPQSRDQKTFCCRRCALFRLEFPPSAQRDRCDPRAAGPSCRAGPLRE